MHVTRGDVSKAWTDATRPWCLRLELNRISIHGLNAFLSPTCARNNDSRWVPGMKPTQSRRHGTRRGTVHCGTIILDGQGLLYTRPMVALAPGIAIAVTVLALNVLGDGIRDALDPRAKLRGVD